LSVRTQCYGDFGGDCGDGGDDGDKNKECQLSDLPYFPRRQKQTHNFLEGKSPMNAVRFFAIALVLLIVTHSIANDFAPVKEEVLIEVLRTGQPAEKAITCKKLAIYGTAASVPELAKLLPDPELSSWSRIALEAIPGPAADEALRKASETVEGRQLVGVLNSIGVRRDAGAVEQLAKRLTDANADVAAAAAVALGQLGNEPATALLRKSLAAGPIPVRSAVAEGCILCAEKQLAAGNAADAAAIYDEVRAADVPMPRKLEATRGAILARGEAGIPLLIEQLRSFDKAFLNIGLTAARELPGKEVAKALAAELAHTTPDRAALMLYALADRKDTVVSPEVAAAATKGDSNMQVAAVGLIGRAGDVSHLPMLLELAGSANAELSAAAKEALSKLPGDEVPGQLATLLEKASPLSLPVLVEVIGKRRVEATPALLKVLGAEDARIRAAALAALGETISEADLPILVKQAVHPQHAADADAAIKALKAASVRMPDREACAAELASALNQADAQTKLKLVDILGAVAGPKALATIAAAMKSGDDAVQDAGSKILGGWMTADAAPVLLEQAKTASAGKYQVRALRGFIRIARQFPLPIDQRAEMCQQALEAARRPEEQKLVLAVLERYASPQTLAAAVKATKTPALRDDASLSALAICRKLGNPPDAKAMLDQAGIKAPEVEILKAEYGAGRNQKDVTDIIRKGLTPSRTVELPKATYNDAFGGDPASGVAKQLKIQFRIGDTTQEKTFSENAPIALSIESQP
jgi:HEAT repeat protein